MNFRAVVSRLFSLFMLAPCVGLAQPAPCTAPANLIVAENCLPGSPSAQWYVGSGDPSIVGFATAMSVNAGATVFFKINTNATAYQLSVFRMGYYGGLGARQVGTASPSVPLPQAQPACINDATTGLNDCGNWNVSASWSVPSNAVSGIYFAVVIRSDTGGASHMYFIVRNDSRNSDILFKTSDSTWQAYNTYGGNSLYAGVPGVNPGRAYKVSYNRPITWSTSTVFNSEYPMVRWLEANGYDVSYFTTVDADQSGALILNHKLMISIGHDEYWSGGERTNVEAARAAGVNLAFFSGNEIFWKTRWENSIDGSATPYRTLVCYKETHGNAKIDPTPTWTGTWMDPRFSPPSDGGRPQNALSGTLFKVNGPTNMGISVPSAYGQLRFWRNTSVASLAPGTTATFATGSLGFEMDIDADNGFRPAGLIDLSSMTATTSDYLLDYGSTYGNGVFTHSFTLYRYSSGALVFSAGDVQYSWNLDSNHWATYQSVLPVMPPADPRIQQATVNLLADMKIQPANLQAGLVPASPSTDTLPPQSQITQPLQYAVEQTPIVITGTAIDNGGGQVAMVEISWDGGITWHPTVGLGNWSYAWTPPSAGVYTLMTRATDDSLNTETPGAGIPITVNRGQLTIWGPGATPNLVMTNDASSLELGVKFRSDVAAWVLGIRFYKSLQNAGVHLGNLWSDNGTLLGSATFTNETAQGWQQVNFSTPVVIASGTTYIASYHTTTGHYSDDVNYFGTAGVDDAPLHALQNGVDGPNGLYAYGASSFPNGSYLSSNYWVDVVIATNLTQNPAPVLNGISPSTAAVGGPSFLLTVNGANFVSSSVVQWNGSPLATTFVSATVLTAAVPAGDLASTGTDNVTVFTPIPGGGASAAISFSITNPVPVLGSISPFTAVVGGSSFTLSVNGTNFVSSSVVHWNGSPLATTFVSGTVLTAVVPAGDIGSAGTANVTVFTPIPGGGTSGSVPLSVSTVPPQAALSIWSSTALPATPWLSSTVGLTVGVKFRSDLAGMITGIRFYKGAGNNGAHVGLLYDRSGNLLAQATFSGETESGWQQMIFPSSVAIAPNTTYVAALFSPSGFAYTSNYFTSSGVDNPPLHALQSGIDGGNGVYAYGVAAQFPNQTYFTANYWVDVVFSAQ
jgi:Domain of unknown function (DUF4082)